MTDKKPWKKNLYENEGYPDNYTDSSFLQQLQKNLNKEDITYYEAVLAAGRVTERLCLVTIFCAIFVFLYNEWIEPQTVFLQTNVAASLCYIFYMTRCCSLPAHVGISRDFKTVIIFLVFGYILSPVLKTLTETISTDTIYATTVSMMVVHLLFCDYNVAAALVSKSLSLNAALFASICLASRLQSSFHAFVLLTISTELFVLFPYFIRLIINPTIPYFCTIIIISVLFLSSTSLVMCILFILVTTFGNVVCPILFVRWQSYKQNIYGPWDEAIVKDNEL